MSHRQFEAARLDITTLGNATTLSVHTIRKAEWKKLKGLDTLTLEGLSLRWLSAPDLTMVPFPACLKSFSLWHSSKLKSLAGIEQAVALQDVHLRENGNPLDLSALAELTSLRVLGIEGGYNTAQQVVDLAPLAGLPIEELTLIAVDGTDLDLTPLCDLPNLRKLDISAPSISPEALKPVAEAHPWFAVG
ncbi:hypothetical protein [Yoonia sp. 2307UL14-13]|uniref:hypothetical protein n=1 Tax=Yoonia sp. 2307UL14-13 TaxID=3126506 RepID=UPI0030B725C1